MAITQVPAPVLDLRNDDAVAAQAIALLPAELSDHSDSNPATVILEACGYIFGKYAYQINRWPSAVIQKVLALCGVTLIQPASATVVQSFTLSAPQATDTTIPKGTQVGLSDSSIIFATTTDVTVPAYTTPTGTAALTSGSTTVTGTGTSFVTGTTWNGWQIQIPAQTGAWYTISSVTNATTLVLTASAATTVATSAFNVGPITATANAQATTTGTATNVGAAKLTTLVSSPNGVASTTNGAAATGGADLETATAAIARAGSAFATRDVACDVTDYGIFAQKILGAGGRAVAKANTNNTTASSGYVTVAMLSPNWTTSLPVSTLERSAVVRDLASRSFTGSTLIDIPATINSYTPTVLFWRKSTVDENTARCNVAAAINTWLSPNTYPWGKSITPTDFVAIVAAATGVDRVEEIDGVPCLTCAATTTTPNAVTFTNGSASATGTAADFTLMSVGRAILIDSTNKAAYLVTAVSAGTLTIDPPFAGASVTTTVSWFNPGDTTFSASTAWMTLPYANLATTVSQPPATVICVGSV